MHLPYGPSVCDFAFGDTLLQLYVPDEQLVRSIINNGQAASRLYWTRVWPSSIALCNFLAARIWIVEGKNVWEPGAGLALPSMLAARFAATITASDVEAEAVAYIGESARLNGYNNVSVQVFDWTKHPAPASGVVLLSDVNYEPALFDQLHSFITGMLNSGVTILLASPARITTAAFFESLEQYATEREVFAIGDSNVAVWMLSKDQME